jgi:hypothetical protein
VVSIGQLFPISNDTYSLIINVVWFAAFFVIILFFNQRMQIWTYQRNVENATKRLEKLAEKSREDALKTIKQFAPDNTDLRSQVTGFLDFFAIEPVDRDPYGVLNRLEHMIDDREGRFKAFVARIAPNGSKIDRSKTEGVLEVAMSLNLLFKVVRHFLLLGKKTKSLMIFVQLDMQLPQLMKIAEAYYIAQETFATGKPMGDGLGALVASKFINGAPTKPIAEDTIYSEIDISGRKAFVLKAEGPEFTVGKPGEAVKRLVEGHEGKIAQIIMIDAAGKLEGETTGEVVEGVGAAIGDPGPEKYKIEEVATKYNIPVDAIICKMDMDEALTTMKKVVAEASDIVVERIKKMIVSRTKEGDIIIIAGIGNSTGVAQ